MKKILLILITFIILLAAIFAISSINIPSPVKLNLHSIPINNFI